METGIGSRERGLVMEAGVGNRELAIENRK